MKKFSILYNTFQRFIKGQIICLFIDLDEVEFLSVQKS